LIDGHLKNRYEVTGKLNRLADLEVSLVDAPVAEDVEDLEVVLA